MEEEFIRYVTKAMRTAAISDCNTILTPGADTRKSKEWSQILATTSDPTELVRRICPEVVDIAVSFLLREIDNGTLSVSVHDNETGDVRFSPEVGELTGDYLATVDW